MLSIVLIASEQFALYLPLILGAFISFSLLKIPNLCIEAAFLAGGIGTHIILQNLPLSPGMGSLFISITASLIGGGLVGIICSLMITHGHLAHLLANIITIGLFSGVNLFLLNGSYVAIPENKNSLVLLPIIKHHPELMVILLIALVCATGIASLLKTPFGKSCIVYGNNPRFFEHHRISASFVLIGGMVVSTALAGLSGFLVSQTNGFLDINGSAGLIILCLTALVLGKRTRGSQSILQPLLGLFVFCVMQQLLLVTGCNLKYFTAIASLLILAIILLTRSKTDKALPTDQLGV